MPDETDAEVVVTAKAKLKNADQEQGGFSLPNWHYGRQYGPQTPQPDPFMISLDQTLPPEEIVARVCESLALAIATLTDLARPVLPKAEAARLDALTTALKASALGLKAGQLDLNTAKTLVRTSLAVAFDTMGGAAMGVLFGALGSWVSTFAPTPLTKALATVGGGVFGLIAAWHLSDTGAANSAAALLADGIFNGANALAGAINSLIQSIYDAASYFPGSPKLPEESSFELRGSPMESNGGGIVTVQVFHDGVAKLLVADVSNAVVIPEDWSATPPDPKSPWNNDSPI